MDKKINVLDIDIDYCSAKEAMRDAIAYFDSEPVNIIELVTVDGLMELEGQEKIRQELKVFDLMLAGDKTILEAADVEPDKRLQEVEDKTFLRMFLRYLDRKHKKVYLLVDSEAEGQNVYEHLQESYRGIQVAGMAKVSAADRADDMIANAINGEEVDLVLSTLSSPLQEELIVAIRSILNTRVWLGLGKSSVPVQHRRFATGRISRFLKKLILKNEIEKRKKRGN